MNMHDPEPIWRRPRSPPARCRLAQGLCDARRRARPARAAARDRADRRRRASRRCRSTTPPAPYTDHDAAIDVEQGLKRARIEWVKERGGVEEYDGRADQAGRQRQRQRQAPRPQLPEHAEAVARARRQAGHPARVGARRRHHQGDDLRRRAREPRPQDSSSSAPRPRRDDGESFGASVPLFITPEFVRERGRARPRHHPVATSTTPNSSR